MSRFLFAPPLGAVCLFAVSSTALADTPFVELPEIVVIATRTATPASQIASSVTVITAEEIAQKQLRTLPDLLAQVPGVNVVQAGGPGAATSVFIRGSNSNHVKVLIDGIDVSDASQPAGAFDFGQLQLADVARVEILRGPQGALYGSDAIGGVISITTRKSEAGSHLGLTAEAGSFGTFNQTASLGGAQGRLRYDLSYAHQQVEHSVVTPLQTVVPGTPIHADSLDNQTFAARFSAALTEQIEAGLVVRYVESLLKFTNGDPYTSAPESVRNFDRNREWFARATLRQESDDGRFDQTLGLATTLYARNAIDPTVPSLTTNNSQRNKLDWQANYLLVEGEKITLGAEAQREQFSNNAPSSGHQTDEAGFVQLQSRLGQHIFNTASLRVDDYNSFGAKTTWRLAPAYVIDATGTKLKATVGTAFKAPTLDQLYAIYPAAWNFYANPNLKPETSTGYDAGFEQKLAGDAVRVGATYFRNDIRNLIDYNASFTSQINIGRATTQGVETGIDWTISPALHLNATYTYTQAHDDTDAITLLRRPKHKGTASAQWQVTDRLALTSTLVVIGPWVDISRDGYTSGIVTGGYTTANLAANYRLRDGLELFARVDNLMDRRYQDPVGFLHPGIGAFAGLRVSLDAKQLAVWQ